MIARAGDEAVPHHRVLIVDDEESIRRAELVATVKAQLAARGKPKTTGR